MTDRKRVNSYILLFTAAYFVSYLLRTNYGAIISEMEQATQMTKPMLSLALTGSFITYSIGQIVSGVCGDLFSPKKLISLGIGISALMNLLIPLCQNPFQMLAVWCVNGFAQAFVWPPLLKLMTALFSEDEYKRASVWVVCGSSLGTMAVYLFAPLLISLWSWKAVFWCAAVCGFLLILLWNKHCCQIEPKKKQAVQTAAAKKGNPSFYFLFPCIMLAIILHGMLKDGVTTWMPSFISETYHLSNVVGILTGVVLPLFGILCVQAVSRLYRPETKNPLPCAGLIFGIGAASSFALLLFQGQNVVYSVVFSAILTGSMHGVNLMLISLLPPLFKEFGRVSTVSGVLNACTYAGSAISTYGIAVLSEQFGWTFTLYLWLLIAFAGTALCFFCSILWKQTKK